jgi:hypothetical protein
VSSDFKDALKGEYNFRHCDNVIVKGKKEAVALYEVFITKDRYEKYCKNQQQDYENAKFLYNDGKFVKAKILFDILNTNSPHTLYEMYSHRCQTLIHEPPPLPFNGIYTATSK